MLIFDELKFMFRPVCKVGTNSFSTYWATVMYGESDPAIKKLRKYQAEKDTLIHLIHDLRHELRLRVRDDFRHACESVLQEKYKDYYKVAFVRNPWCRAVSAFRELVRRYPFSGSVPSDEIAGLTYGKIYDLMEGHISFDNFVNFIVHIEQHHTDNINGHWNPQVNVIMSEDVKYDFIGKMEHIDSDVDHMQKVLNLKRAELPKEHITTKYNYKLYYQNSKTVDMVSKYYKHDIEEFNYDYDVK